MLEHTFRRVVLRNGERSKVKLAVDFAEEGYGLLSVFMASEVPNFWREIMAEVRLATEDLISLMEEWLEERER